MARSKPRGKTAAELGYRQDRAGRWRGPQGRLVTEARVTRAVAASKAAAARRERTVRPERAERPAVRLGRLRPEVARQVSRETPAPPPAPDVPRETPPAGGGGGGGGIEAGPDHEAGFVADGPSAGEEYKPEAAGYWDADGVWTEGSPPEGYWEKDGRTFREDGSPDYSATQSRDPEWEGYDRDKHGVPMEDGGRGRMVPAYDYMQHVADLYGEDLDIHDLYDLYYYEET